VDLGDGYHRIVNRHSGKVLNVAGAGTADGADVDQWDWQNVDPADVSDRARPLSARTPASYAGRAGVGRQTARGEGRAYARCVRFAKLRA